MQNISKNISKFFKKYRISIFGLIFLYFLAISIRLCFVKNYNFPFWFDPGRDAAVSREILENKDFKIQGPTASGTGDAVYHGVIYYYFIGPLYTVFAGDPQLVLNTLIIFSSLAIFAVYALAFELSHQRSTAFLAAFLYAISFEAVRGNAWLSNPVIASTTIPYFFYLLYLIFFQKKTNKFLLPALAFVLALTHQSVILFVTLWGVVAASFFYAAQDKKFLKNLDFKNIILSLIIYILGIASMLLAQLKAYSAGIFNLKTLSSAAANHSDLTSVWGTARLYLEKSTQVFFPSLPVLSLIILIFLIIFVVKNLNKDKQVFLLLAAASPLFLLSWHYRNMYHSFLALEAIAVIVLGLFIASLNKLKFGKVLQILLIILFLFSNYSAFKLESKNKTTPYYLPQGAYLREQLDLIDKSYQLAAGEDFSISSITNPFGYNTLWAYLYSWYGQEKYGYTPRFYGPSQKGLYAQDLLAETATPSEIHFCIHEPVHGIPVWLRNDFSSQQEIVAGEIKQTYEFGTLKLEQR